MGLLISTNMYQAGELERVFPFLESEGAPIGLELFPLFHVEAYEQELKGLSERLLRYPISFHGPYYRAEHSAAKGSEAYERTMEYVKKTLEYCVRFNSRYMVFHHNNCRVRADSRAEMIRISCENYREVERLYARHQIPVVVENAGVIERENMLFHEGEFIELCKREQYPVLIDIGHAHANRWNLEHVICELKDQIVAYHIHNNDGFHDDHKRIRDGSLDFPAFMECFKKYTGTAELVLEYSTSVSTDEAGIAEDVKYVQGLLQTFYADFSSH